MTALAAAVKSIKNAAGGNAVMVALLALASAVLLWASFPPVNAWPLAWVALAPLLIALDRARSWQAAWGIAYLSGFVFFLMAIGWIRFVTVPGLVVLSAYLALFFGILGSLHYYIRHRFSSVSTCFLLSAGWVILEYFRSTLFTGFGWASLWASQADFKSLLPLASVTGAAGISFLVILVNIVLKERLVGRLKQNWIVGVVLAALIFIVGWGAVVSAPVNRTSAAIPIAVIQPNISLAEALDSRLKADLVHRQLELSRRTLAHGPKLVIWPETSFPRFMWDSPELVEEIQSFARENGVYVLFGAVTRKNEQYYNSAVLISPFGAAPVVRSKRHLVVFGEYIPFREKFPILADMVPIDDLTPGEEDALFDVPGLGKFGVLICFEDTLPEVARRYVRQGAGFLVNMTNDAWYRDSGQPRMHLNNALFRSVENRRMLVRATNTGESCVVDAFGRETECVKDNQDRRVLIEGFMVVSVNPEVYMTVNTNLNETFVLICGLVFLISVLFIMRRKLKRLSPAKKILLIDDDRTMHTMLKTILSTHGFEMISAVNGEVGLSLAKTEKPDLILLDVIMPTLKGREVCQRLKACPETVHIPVLFFTSKSSPDDLAAEVKVGSVGHITKPVNSATLISFINKTLRL